MRQYGTVRGFALLAILWIIIGLSVLALAAGDAGRHALIAAQMERDRVAGRWYAEGCLAHLRSVTNSALADASGAADHTWCRLDTLLLRDSAAALAGCDLSVRPSGRIVLGRASMRDLDTLPGMTPEAVALIATLQQMRMPIDALPAVERRLSPVAQAIFAAHYTELLRATTVEPDVWRVRVRVHGGPSPATAGWLPPVPVTIEMQLARSGGSTVITRWVEW